MSNLTAEVATKVSTQGKPPKRPESPSDETQTLNSPAQRRTLSSFYVAAPPDSTQLPPADITLNGNRIPTPTDLETLFTTQMPRSHYEVQSYDCHVLNPNYNLGAPDADLGPDPTGRKMSILLVVSGYVKYGDDLRQAAMRGFTENFILVPNFQSAVPPPQSQVQAKVKKWLIQSQNFRLVV
ncbi:MAG: hypothetical protein M1818_003875 [Claussenomyces sp. TS43310]|nr:MAG: hypothetical protein M1818_003875 [Claussenomyces sp. TS43310]